MHRHTVADFNQLGTSGGFRYRLPELPARALDDETRCIAEGRVERWTPQPGLSMVLSDIATHHAYAATSDRHPAFSAIVMLRGQAQAEMTPLDALTLAPRQGALIVGNQSPLSAYHPAQPHMRSVNVSIDAEAAAHDPCLSELLDQVRGVRGRALRRWKVQPHLATGLEQLFDDRWQGSLHALRCQGAALQVLASALHHLTDDDAAARPSPVLPRDQRRLERVRELLDTSPGADHSLDSLARVACMSPSSLRNKFQQAYQCTVFDWLRERRLQLARERIAQGWSVQQAAHFVGYRHATNFATAFRERFGIAPSQVR